MSYTNNDNSLCHTDKPGDGCNGSFPNKTLSGLCLKCQGLEAATTEEEKARIDVCVTIFDCGLILTCFKNIPQCLECGAIGKHIKNEKCATCMRKGMSMLY